MTLQSVSIRTKLIVAFATLTVFVVGLGILGLVSTQKLRDQTVAIETNWLPSIRTLSEINTLTARSSGLLLRHTQATDPALLATIEKDIGSFDRSVDDKAKFYRTLISSPEEQALDATLSRASDAFRAVRDQVLALSRRGDKAQAYALYETNGLA
ncbi:MAG: methyl-accepting chemotaxis protein, partial [Proteobacteria bacterium]